MTGRAPRRPRRPVLAVAALALAGLVAACAGGTEAGDGAAPPGPGGDCVVVDVAVSSEKVQLLGDLAREFERSGARAGGRCIDVEVRSKASGSATTALARGWDPAIDGPAPVIWSPASSAWGSVLNQRLSTRGEPPLAPQGATPFMLTPLVIAMPEPMARALGWPDQPIGWSDILELARSDAGWAAFGHPEWGDFRLGKTNPNFSTSGLHALIAQSYAATGSTADLTAEALADPAVVQYGTDIESAVVHYGDITMTFLNNWYRADRRGTGLTYASAVAVEEKSVIDYNAGNPDGVLDRGEEPRPPRVPLVAVYPEEGTLFSDNPLYVLDADWVTPAQRDAAGQFREFVQRPANQRTVLRSGFRPGNPEVAVGAPVTADNGVDPDQPQTLLEVPTGAVMDQLLDNWAQQRKGARVLLVLDVSGSMGEPADPADPNGPTKLDLAKQAVTDGLDEFKASDLVGLRVFTSDIGGDAGDFVDLAPLAPVGPARERLRQEVDRLVPLNGTPLYDVTRASYDEMLAGYDPALINAVVVLTDGMNDDGTPQDDRRQLDDLLTTVRRGSEGENSRPVRIFTVAYGAGTNPAELQRIAEASNATGYTATDATTIDAVFAAVVSNF